MNTASKDLDALRETASKALIALLWLHVPIALTVGMAHGAWLMPTALDGRSPRPRRCRGARQATGFPPASWSLSR